MGQLPFPVFGDVSTPIKGSGKGKTVLLYEFIRQVAGTFPIRNQTIGDCMNPTAMVRMADGTQKPIAQVEVGDEVLTPQGNVKPVLSLLKKPFSEKMIKIRVKGYHEPISLTPDHLCMILPNVGRGKRGDKHETKWVPANELTSGDKFLIPKTASYLTKTYDLVEHLPWCNFITEDDDYKKLRTQKVSYGKTRVKGSSKELNRHITLNEKLGWLIGMFAAEGTYDNSRITFNLSSQEMVFAKKIEMYVSEIFGLDTHIYQAPSKPSVLYARVSNKAFAEFMHVMCSGNTYTKKLHPDLLVATEDVKLGILSGWMNGDGWQDTVGVSVNQDLIYNMFDISISLGINASITNRKPRKQSKKSYGLSVNSCVLDTTTEQCKLSVSNRCMTKLGKAATIKSIEYVEPDTNFVYCIEVQDDHAFIADRYAVHNCVSQGAAYAVDAVKAVDIVVNKDFELWVAETATEDIYAGSRVQIGRGQIGRDDGSIGAWAARYVNEYGAVARGKYGNVDLRTYDGQKAKRWGMPSVGVPESLIPKARMHSIETVSQVNTYEECRDLIANGYAVTIASNQGFSNRRDSEGFARPEGSWAHQMSILAVDDAYRRPGVLVQNSWGVWNAGPKRHNQPDGSFWVDARDIERLVLSQGDSWAFSGYSGFKPQQLNTFII